MLGKMSDDIPPLIPETPPPMTKLDWEDDEDFMDYPHLALELPSESSLSPDGGWNPIDELPYDVDIVDKPVGCDESNTNDDSTSIEKNDQYLKSLPEQELHSHQNNMPIWKDKENIVPWENIKKLKSNHSCDSVNELDCKTEIKLNVSSETVIENNRKIIDNDLTVPTDQHKNNIVDDATPQYLPDLEHQSSNSELIENSEIVQCKTNFNAEISPHQETLVNGHLEFLDPLELSNQTNCVQKVLLENFKNDVSDNNTRITSSNGMYDLSINNNNNIIIKNDQDEYTDFCDFETAMPSSLKNVSLPNRTFQEQNELTENQSLANQHYALEKISDTHLNDEHSRLSENISTQEEIEVTQIIKSINPSLHNQKDAEMSPENNLDSEFDDFCDFHAFPSSGTENNPMDITNEDDFCDFETSKLSLNNKTEFKHSNIEQAQLEVDNDDNFCDFESGYSTSSLPVSNQVLDVKENNVVLGSESQVQIDYKQFCKDAFQGDYELCDEVDLQNLDIELNETLVWKNLKDVESSPALNYNWSKSESNNVFLSSLSIDSRNILYGASWNAKVPRFAANMSNNPLEPLKASNNDSTDTKISQSFSNGPLQETVPDPEFDWKSSGLINPLDFQPQTWKTSEVVKDEESPVLSSPESLDVFDKLFGVSLPSPSDNQSIENIESPSSAEASVSLEAQMILDNLPDFEVLQKPYLVILEKGNNNLFLN